MEGYVGIDMTMNIAVIRNGLNDHTHVFNAIKQLGFCPVDVHSSRQIKTRHVDFLGASTLKLAGFSAGYFDQVFFINWPMEMLEQNASESSYYPYAETRAAAVSAINAIGCRVINLRRLMQFNELLDCPANHLAALREMGWNTPSMAIEFPKDGDPVFTYSPDLDRLPKFAMVNTIKGYKIVSPYPGHGLNYALLDSLHQNLHEYLFQNQLDYCVIPFVVWDQIYFASGLSQKIPHSIKHDDLNETLLTILGQ